MAEGAVTPTQSRDREGDLRRSRAVALDGLARHPDDPELLWMAGSASLELDADDAAEHFARLVELDPGHAPAWRGLGSALQARGRLDEAAAAFDRAVDLRPDDVPALIDLGHAAYGQGRTDDAAAYLSRAARLEPGNVDLLRSVTAVHRRRGQTQAALDTARLLVERRPEDVGATLEVAELSLELGRLDDAAAAYQSLRRIDAEGGHEVYAYHGLIAVELRRQDWRRALTFAIDAARVDRQQRTTDLLAFAAARLFGPSDRPPPAPAQVERIIAESVAEHRSLHVEPLAF